MFVYKAEAISCINYQ